MKSNFKSLVAGMLSIALLALSGPTWSGMIGNDRLAQSALDDRAAVDRQAVQEFLSRADVVQTLVDFGVAPGMAADRVAHLTDDEASRLARNIESDPAGAGALGLIGAVFLVLLILELVGVTDIFKRI